MFRRKPKLTQDDLEDLVRRMHNHSDVNGVAVVVLTAGELENLIIIASEWLTAREKA